MVLKYVYHIFITDELKMPIKNSVVKMIILYTITLFSFYIFLSILFSKSSVKFLLFTGESILLSITMHECIEELYKAKELDLSKLRKHRIIIYCINLLIFFLILTIFGDVHNCFNGLNEIMQYKLQD